MNEKDNAAQQSEVAREETEKLPSDTPITDSQQTPEQENENPEPNEVQLDEDESTATFSIDDVVDAAGYGKFQKFLTFLAGLGWLADAFEVIILSIIGEMLACHWEMGRWQNALMTSIVFAGMTVGAPCFGIFADKFGRRMSLAISMLLLFIFGASSAASPNYVWMVVLRGFMGFALGGIAQGVTLCCEYYPANVRGRAGFYLSYYWSIGSIGVVLAAWLIMSRFDNWRVFVFVASLPALVVFLVMKWYPESARYYLVSNQPKRAIAVLERMMRMNKKEMLKGRLVELHAAEQRGKILDLLKPNIRRATLIFWYIWFAVACAYYGVALLTPLIVRDGSLVAAAAHRGNKTFIEGFREIMPCKKFSNENFLDLFWTTAAEFPGLLVFTFTVEFCARGVFLGSSLMMLAFLLLFLMTEMEPKIAMLIVLFMLRALVAAIFQLLFIMTTEAFPTTLRASAMGTGSGCARFGGLVIPYLTQVVVISKPVVAIFILVALTTLAGIAAFLLPSDTRRKHMQEYVD